MLLPLAVVTMGLLGPSAIAQNIFNCSSFASSGSCGYGSGQNFYNASQAGGLAGSAINLTPSGSNHNSYNVQYKTRVNIQAFTTTFTFVPNGYNLAFVIQNCNIGTTCNGPGGVFAAGAGGEGGFTQFEPSPNQWPNNLFALMLDQFSAETNTGSFDYSTAQIYQTLQAPYLPISCGSSCVPIYSTNKISTSPVPLNSPATTQGTTTGDTYSATIVYDGQTITFSLYDVTAGGSCPGATCFTHSWPVFIPSIVQGTTANIGFANGVGESPATNLTINSWSYTVNTPGPLPTSTVTYSNSVANPTFSPAPGSYTGTQDVTISTTTPNAYICYTLAATPPTFLPQPDNNGGCNEGTLYSSPVSVSSTQTLYAMAGSSIKNYPSGAENSTGLGPPSSIVTGTYAIGTSGTAATPTFSPVPGTYSSPQTVTISDSTSGATIYYTTNGSTPTTASTAYTGPIAVGSTETIKALAVVPGDTNSAVGSAAYTIDLAVPTVSTPIFSPAAGIYSSAQSVAISDDTVDATIYYTTDGSTPTTSSTQYTGPITVSASETMNAIAVVMGDNNSAVASSAYTIMSSLPSAATPTFAPAGGAYTSAQPVTLSDTTPGATIYYTTNGATPTTSSTVYTGPITVSSTEALQAIAVAAGDSNSAVASAAYTISVALPSVATPIFSPSAGTYNSAQSVTISDATSGATIYYTTDGSTPTTSSTAYTSPIAVTSTETLQAIAEASGDSAVASAAYSITAQPNFMLATSVNTLTVNSGGQGTIMVTVTPENGFNSPVVLACTGLPDWATCSFSESTVTTVGGAATTQLTISTSSQSSALQPRSRVFFPFTALAMTVGFFGWRKRRSWHLRLLLVVAYAGLGFLFGCSGTSAASGNSSPSAATSTVTVTAISGTLKGSAAIAITLN